MSRAFATKDPSNYETELLRLLLSCYRDGSGAERERDNSTRANWRQIERCFADLFEVQTNEDKNIFDLFAPSETNHNIWYGFSVKSKQLSAKKFHDLEKGSRVYMEIANSPAKFWDAVKLHLGLSENDFSQRKNPTEIGRIVIQTVKNWHEEGKVNFDSSNKGQVLNLDFSVYLSLSYSSIDELGNRFYQAHSFSLDLPENLHWEYSSDKCLTAYDPNFPSDRLFDWYALSGGQLKYYPKGTAALWKSRVFKLEKPDPLSSIKKVGLLFPESYKNLILMKK